MGAESVGGKLCSREARPRSSTDLGLWLMLWRAVLKLLHLRRGLWAGQEQPPAALRGSRGQSRAMLSPCKRQGVGYWHESGAVSMPRSVLSAWLVGVFFWFVLLLPQLWTACCSPGTPAIERS